MLETLLAVVLLSIGLLASARMQVQGLAETRSSYALSQARFLALDMAERLRANRDGLKAGLYDGLTTSSVGTQPECLAAGTVCTAAERFSADRYAWNQAFTPPGTKTLPPLPSNAKVTAGGSVTSDATTGIRTVSVTWADERLGTGDDAARSFSVQVMPSTLP